MSARGADHPWPPNDLTEQYGHVIREFIDKAIDSGLDVFLQIGGCGGLGFPGLRDEDRPRLPDGTVASERMADTGCLASPAIRQFNRAYTKDLLLE